MKFSKNLIIAFLALISCAAFSISIFLWSTPNKPLSGHMSDKSEYKNLTEALENAFKRRQMQFLPEIIPEYINTYDPSEKVAQDLSEQGFSIRCLTDAGYPMSSASDPANCRVGFEAFKEIQGIKDLISFGMRIDYENGKFVKVKGATMQGCSDTYVQPKTIECQ